MKVQTDIEVALKEMTPRSRLFNLIKQEMKLRGYWKNKARGKSDIRHLAGRKYTDATEY